MTIRTLTTSQLKQYREILVELSKRLNNTCSTDCPRMIFRADNDKAQIAYHKNISGKHHGWECEHCIIYFSFISGSHVNVCPCFRASNKEEVIIALEEQIQDFTTQLSTRWED